MESSERKCALKQCVRKRGRCFDGKEDTKDERIGIQEVIIYVLAKWVILKF